jgi:hypothetical protein
MWHRVGLVWTDVSEERITSIFREGKSASEEPECAGGCRLSLLVPRSRNFVPWRWRRCVTSKLRFTQDLHGATSQKTAFSIVTAVETSNLTRTITHLQTERNVADWDVGIFVWNILILSIIKTFTPRNIDDMIRFFPWHVYVLNKNVTEVVIVLLNVECTWCLPLSNLYWVRIVLCLVNQESGQGVAQNSKI